MTIVPFGCFCLAYIANSINVRASFYLIESGYNECGSELLQNALKLKNDEAYVQVYDENRNSHS